MNTSSPCSTLCNAQKLSGMRGNAAATAIICLIVAGLAGTLLTRFLSPVQVSVSDAALVAEADYLAESYLAMLRQKIRHAGGREAAIAFFNGRPVVIPVNGQKCVVTGTLINDKNSNEEYKGSSPAFAFDNGNIKLTLSIALPYTDAKGNLTKVRADRVLYIVQEYLNELSDNKRSSFSKLTAIQQFSLLRQKLGGTLPLQAISCFSPGWKAIAQKKKSSDQDMYWSLTSNDDGWEYRSAYLPIGIFNFPTEDTVCVNVLFLSKNEASTTRKVTWTGESKAYKDLPCVPSTGQTSGEESKQQ